LPWQPNEKERLAATSGRLSPEALARIAAPYGTTYQEKLTAMIEQEYGVSVTSGWRSCR
jgi:hypothetical protein